MRRWKMNFEPIHDCIGARPHPSLQAAALTKCAMATFSLCSNIATRTIDRYDKEQTLPLASLKAWWLAPAQQASQNAYVSLMTRTI